MRCPRTAAIATALTLTLGLYPAAAYADTIDVISTTTAVTADEIITPAEAEQFAPNASQITSAPNFLQGLRELEASTLPRLKLYSPNGDYGYRYAIAENVELTLPSAYSFEQAMSGGGTVMSFGSGDSKSQFSVFEEAQSVQDTGGSADVQIRTKGWRTAVGLSQRDQKILKNALATTIVTAVLCAGTGPWGCALIGFVVSVAFGYVKTRGICSYNRTLWWYDVRGGSTIQCRSTAPF